MAADHFVLHFLSGIIIPAGMTAGSRGSRLGETPGRLAIEHSTPAGCQECTFNPRSINSVKPSGQILSPFSKAAEPLGPLR